MLKKMLSLLLAVMMVVSVMAVGVVSTGAATTDEFTPDPAKLYFDVDGTGWEMGTKNKVAFHIFGGDLGTEENPTAGLPWMSRKAVGTATAGENGVFEIDPAAKLGITLNPGVQYKIIFARTESSNWKEQTYDLLFTTDCLGHVAYCDGTEYENPVDSSKKTLAAFWRDMDASAYGPVKQISSIGNVVGTCLAEGTTDESLFNDFLTVVDSTTGKTKYDNAYQFVVEPGTKTEQKMIDDIGAGLGLAKQEIQAAFEAAEIETAWDYAASSLHEHTPAEPVQENVVPATYKAGGSYDSVVYCSDPTCGKEISRETVTTDPVELDPAKLYFDVDGTGWEMGTKNKVAFHIFGGDLGTEENPTAGLPWMSRKAVGAATAGLDGVFEIDPAAKLGITLNPGVQYKIIFARTESSNWKEQTYDLLFTTDCLGHVAYCDGTEYENPVDSSKKTLAAFWYDMDASAYGPVKQISSIGNVVGTCLAEGTTDESLFTDFLTVVDSTTGKTKYDNAYQFVVEPGTKTDQKLIDDIGTDLGLTKQQVFDAFYNNNVETTWDYTVSTLPGDVTPPHTHTPGDPVIENDHASTCTTAGSYDEVIYCTECHEEISRETKYHDLAAHTPGDPVIEKDHASTCTVKGSYDEVTYCTACHTELSRETKYHDLAAHHPGTPVIENDHASTCTVKGSYDEVTYCTECQAELSRETKYHDLAAHHPGTPVIENDHASTCTVKGSYEEVTYCTACHAELSRETKYHDLAPHTPGQAIHENEVVTHDKTTYTEVVKCTVCQAEISRTPVELPIITHTLTFVPEVPATEQATGTKAHYTCSGCDKLFADAAGTHEVTPASLIIPKLDHVHTPGTAVRENEVPATCTAAGSYDEVVYCTSCHAELSRTPKTIAKLAHTLTFKPGKQATEQAEGWNSYFQCSVCKKYFADANGEHELTWDEIVIPKIPHTHTPGTAVRENEIPATCKTAGSYDEVVYCTSCQAEISRTHKTIAKLAHTPGTAVRENEVPATCKAAGSYDEVVYCTVCHDEISRTHKTIAKLAHTPGTAVRENEVPATCTAAGSYDEVVYCTVCHEEISRTPKTIAKLAHSLTFRPYKAATEEADGWNAHYYCSECGKYFSDAEGKNELTWDQIMIPRIVIGKLGDIDGDGEVTIFDVTIIQRVLAGIKTADATMKKLGDVDGDDDLTITDAALIQRWLLGLNQDLNIGKDV